MFLKMVTAISRTVKLVFFLFIPILASANDCEAGHWIQEVFGGGKIIKLEDGSLWQVSSIDVITSVLWLPVSEIAVCGNTMINTDDDESVTVTPITQTLERAPIDRPYQERGYVIEAAVNDEVFIINGETYEAKTYCFGFDQGDPVKFIDGSAFGACVSAEFLHLNSGKTCRVWCE